MASDKTISELTDETTLASDDKFAIYDTSEDATNRVDLSNIIGGSDGQILFNNSGTFGTDANLTWDSATPQLLVENDAQTTGTRLGPSKLESAYTNDSLDISGGAGIHLNTYNSGWQERARVEDSGLVMTNGFDILDANSNELLTFTSTASAVNEVDIANAASGSGPTISTTGGDANIDLNLSPKGSGAIEALADIDMNNNSIRYNQSDGTDNFRLIEGASQNVIIDADENQKVGINTFATTARFTVKEDTDSASNEMVRLVGNNRSGGGVPGDEAYESIRLDDSGGSEEEFLRRTVVATDTTDPSEDGQYRISAVSAGSLTEVFRVDSSGISLDGGTTTIDSSEFNLLDGLSGQLFDTAGTGLSNSGSTLNLNAATSDLTDAASPNATAAGQLLIWHATNSQFENATLSSSEHITITNADGSVTIGSNFTASSTDTLTNKTIDADGTGNSISNIGANETKLGDGLEGDGSDNIKTSEPFVYDSGITQWADALSNEEVNRIALQTGETLVVDRIEVRQKGGGSSASFSARVQDLTAASTVGSQTLGGTTKNPGSSGTANTVAVQVSNSTGGTINGAIRIIGRITGA